MRRRLATVLAFAGVLATREAYGEPIYRIKSPSKLETAKGSKLELPPGYFLDEETWQKRDEEMRRLQDQETRLKAENVSLRKSAAEDYPWVATGAVLVFGIAFGAVYALSVD